MTVLLDNMIDGQIFPNIVLNKKIINAIRKIPRELFVPDSKKLIAHSECDIKLASKGLLFKPLTIARIIKYIDIIGLDTVLIVNNDDGYLAAIVSQIVDTVIIFEESENNKNRIIDNLNQLEINNWAFIKDFSNLKILYNRIIYSEPIIENVKNAKKIEKINQKSSKNSKVLYISKSSYDIKGNLITKIDGRKSFLAIF